jgi:hypothetical protein
MKTGYKPPVKFITAFHQLPGFLLDAVTRQKAMEQAINDPCKTRRK